MGNLRCLVILALLLLPSLVYASDFEFEEEDIRWSDPLPPPEPEPIDVGYQDNRSYSFTDGEFGSVVDIFLVLMPIIMISAIFMGVLS